MQSGQLDLRVVTPSSGSVSFRSSENPFESELDCEVKLDTSGIDDVRQ